MALRLPKAEVPAEVSEPMIHESAALSPAVADGRVTRVYLVRNPRKLTPPDGTSRAHP
jgi:hypothetical protein